MSREPISEEPSTERLPEREIQALREAGRTEVSRPLAAALAALFLATVVAVPLLRPWSGSGEPALAPFRERLYGLTTNLQRLVNIRQERRPNSRYSSMKQCRYELTAVEEMYQRHRIKFINTARMSVEEISARIIRDNGLHRIEMP